MHVVVEGEYKNSGRKKRKSTFGKKGGGGERSIFRVESTEKVNSMKKLGE